MEKIYHVYKITNALNNKIYIGKTSGNNPNKRFRAHINLAKRNNNNEIKYALHHSILKHGEENFSFKVLESFENEDDAYNKEIFYIKHFDSINPKNGYNLDIGGKGSREGNNSSKKKFNDENIVEIFNIFYNDKSVKNIANKFNCSIHTIIHILNRKKYYWVKINEEIEKEVAKIMFNNRPTIISMTKERIEKICKEYENGTPIKKIIKKYNTSDTKIKKTVKDFFGDELGSKIINNNEIKKRITEEVAYKIFKDYTEIKLTVKEICEKYNICKSSCRKLLNGNFSTMNINKEMLDKAKYITLPSYCKFSKEIISDFIDGISIIDIIKKYNTSRVNILKILDGKVIDTDSETLIKIKNINYFEKMFDENKINDIFNEFISGKNGPQIAKKYNTDKTTIYQIINRKIYLHVKIDENTLNKVNLIKQNKKKTSKKLLNNKDICNDYISGLSYSQISKKYNTSDFTVSRIVKNILGQEIIDKNKMQKISQEFGNAVISDYLNTNMTQKKIAEKYNVSHYVISDLLRGKTFKISEDLVNQIKLITKSRYNVNKIKDEINIEKL